MEYYKTAFMLHLKADQETRKASREHWTNIHAKNVLAGDEESINWSARILAAITMAEELEMKQAA